MCLGLAIRRPDAVLSTGHHAGYDWAVIHNGIGYRCGYVRIPPGHPWHGLDYDAGPLQGVRVHGGLTFAEADVPCTGGGPEDAWWLGFDCGHAGDAVDPSLPGSHRNFSSIPAAWFGDQVRTTGYVEGECRSLCEQAAGAARPKKGGK